MILNYTYFMARMKSDYIPSTSEIKILETVSYLNEKNLYPLPLGVYKILIGSSEDEYIIYHDIPTYRTLTSFSSKHISRLIMMLLRNNYLAKIYDEKTNELYLKITDKGVAFLLHYHKKHKYSFHKKTPSKKPLIVEIK